MIPWSFSWNNLRLRPLRTLLTVLSIAGGVAAVVAVLQAIAATRGQLDSMQKMLGEREVLDIVADDTSAFSISTLPDLSQFADVQKSIPVFRVFTKIMLGSEEARGIAVGTNLDEYLAGKEYAMISGKISTAANEVCLEASVAEHLHATVGDEIRIGAKGLPWLLTKQVTGILKFEKMTAVEETASIFMPLADAARLGKAPGKATSLHVQLKPDVDSDTLIGELEKTLEPPLVVNKPASAADMTRPTEAIINIGLNVAALLSVVAAVFIVINTFQISVTERRKQTALIRIVGATTEQVTASMYREAFVLGSIGTLAGLVAGVFGSAALSHGMDGIYGFERPLTIPIHPLAIMAGVIFGPVVTLISVWYPTRCACEHRPLAVLKSASAPHRDFPVRRAMLWGCIVLAIAMLMFACTFWGIMPDVTSILGIASVQIAGVVWLPALIRPVSSALYAVIRKFFPVEAQLGQRQLLDNFGRTSLTMSVMFIVSATSIGVGNTTLSIAHDVQSWLDRTLTADFLLRASKPRVDMSEAAPLPPELESQVRKIAGVESIDHVSFSLALIDGNSVTLMSRSLKGQEPLPVDLVEGAHSELKPRMLAGQAVVGTVLAHRLGVRSNGKIRLEIGGVSHDLLVAGIAREYTAGGLMVIMDSSAAAELFPIQPAQIFGIKASATATDSTGTQLQEFCREHGLIFQSYTDLRELVQSLILGLTDRLWMILILALVIAGFAIVNTLTMNVIEQTRYLGLLRVVGMTRTQVIRMFLFQAFVLGTLALLPGAFTGILMAWLITVSYAGVIEHAVQFSVDTQLLGLYLSAGILLSIMSAVLPAIRAGRLKPLEAIHQE
ncbi:MAG: FtsX-like permease family protein [Planctomycetaceae bacterium]